MDRLGVSDTRKHHLDCSGEGRSDRINPRGTDLQGGRENIRVKALQVFERMDPKEKSLVEDLNHLLKFVEETQENTTIYILFSPENKSEQVVFLRAWGNLLKDLGFKGKIEACTIKKLNKSGPKKVLVYRELLRRQSGWGELKSSHSSVTVANKPNLLQNYYCSTVQTKECVSES